MLSKQNPWTNVQYYDYYPLFCGGLFKMHGRTPMKKPEIIVRVSCEGWVSAGTPSAQRTLHLGPAADTPATG